MTRGKALFRNTLIYSAGTFGGRFLGFLLLPFYTSILSKADYGYIDLVTMGSTLFITVVTLKLFDGAYRFLWDLKTEEDRIRLVSTVLNATLALFLFGFLLTWLGIGASGGTVLYAGLIFAWLLMRVPAEFFQQTARAFGKSHVYSISGLILAVSMLVLNLVLLGYYDFGVAGYLWTMVISYFLTLLYCIWAGAGAAYYRPQTFEFDVLRPMLRYSLPLLPAAISWWVIRVSGRYVLSYHHGLDAAGIYAVSDKLPTVLYLISATFYMAWQDAAMKHYADADRQAFFGAAMSMYLRIGLSAVVLITLFLKPFFFVMIGAAYHDAHVYIPWLLLAVLIMSWAGLYDVIFIAEKRTDGILWSALLAAVVSIVLNLILVPAYAIWATTVSTLLGAVVLIGFRMWQLREKAKFPIEKRPLILLLLVFAAAAAVQFLSGWAYIAMAVLIVLVVAALNRSSLLQGIAIVKRKLGRV